MAETGKEIKPFTNCKFHVEVGQIKEAVFKECSGLEVSTDLIEYYEGGLNEYPHKLPGRTKLSNVTLKRGFTTSNELFNWYSEMESDLLQGKSITRKQVTIKLYSTLNNEDLMSWTLNDAFPVKWVGPVFNAGDAAVAIETLEFAHHGIKPG